MLKDQHIKWLNSDGGCENFDLCNAYISSRVIICLFLNGPFGRGLQESLVYFLEPLTILYWSWKKLLASPEGAGSLCCSSICCWKQQKVVVFPRHPGLHPQLASSCLPYLPDYIFINSCFLALRSIIFQAIEQSVSQLPPGAPGEAASSAYSDWRSASPCQACDTAERMGSSLWSTDWIPVSLMQTRTLILGHLKIRLRHFFISYLRRKGKKKTKTPHSFIKIHREIHCTWLNHKGCAVLLSALC